LTMERVVGLFVKRKNPSSSWNSTPIVKPIASHFTKLFWFTSIARVVQNWDTFIYAVYCTNYSRLADTLIITINTTTASSNNHMKIKAHYQHHYEKLRPQYINLIYFPERILMRNYSKSPSADKIYKKLITCVYLKLYMANTQPFMIQFK
jgi:hypothetical protein